LISPSCWFKVITFSGIFIPEEDGGVGERGARRYHNG